MGRPPAPAPGAAAHVFVADIEHPELDDGDIHHLERVLRLRAGQTVTVCDGAGRWRPCRWEAGGAVVPDGAVVMEPRPTPEVTVAFAPVKGDRPEWAVQKLTELGVDRVVPLIAARSVVRWEGERGARQVERLRRVAREAAMQSRRAWLPMVAEVHDVAAFLVAAGAGSVPPGTPEAAAGAAGAGGPVEEVALADRGGAPPELTRPTVLIGPEGGWTPEEVAAAPARVGLGPNVLRAETAAVVAGALLVALRSGLVAPPPTPPAPTHGG